MLEYAYYTNLSSADKCLFSKCHTLHNELYHDVFQILKPFGINATDGSNQIRSRPNRPRQIMASQTQSVPSISDT